MARDVVSPLRSRSVGDHYIAADLVEDRDLAADLIGDRYLATDLVGDRDLSADLGAAMAARQAPGRGGRLTFGLHLAIRAVRTYTLQSYRGGVPFYKLTP